MSSKNLNQGWAIFTIIAPGDRGAGGKAIAHFITLLSSISILPKYMELMQKP
ncbi:MAG: hypothetical protein MET45_01835 [Nostoc sp. LLA-1]|nr:hypothetical protein [Cyanocohniella sp. LLY]